MAVHESNHSLFSALARAGAVVCMLFTFVFSASAGGHNRLFGCATDANGHPLLRAKVVAVRWQDPGLFSNKRDWKAETDKSTGCYEMRNLPDGEYRVALENSGFSNIYSGHFGPPQGFVQFGENESKEVNLTNDFPMKSKLMVGVANVLGNSSTGFTSLRGNQLINNDLWYYGGLEGWYMAPVLPGFDACSTGSFRGDAYYKCELRYLKTVEFAKEMHSRITDAIVSVAATQFPDLGPAQVGQCSNQKLFLGYRCVQTTHWNAPKLNITVDTNGSRVDQYIEVTIIVLGRGSQ